MPAASTTPPPAGRGSSIAVEPVAARRIPSVCASRVRAGKFALSANFRTRRWESRPHDARNRERDAGVVRGEPFRAGGPTWSPATPAPRVGRTYPAMLTERL
jgi:hypothetical protein